MKPAVAIALIAAGLFLIALPTISDYLWRAHSVRLLENPGISSVNLSGEMEPLYKFGCFVVGVVCLGIAIRYSIGRAEAN